MIRYAIFGLLASLSGGFAAVEVSEKEKVISIANDLMQFEYHLDSGRYQAIRRETGVKAFSNAIFTVDEVGWKQRDGATRTWSESLVEDEFGKWTRLSVTETPKGGYRLIKTLHLSLHETRPFAVLGFSVTNQHGIPARVSRIGVIDKARLFGGQKLEEPRLLRGGAGAERNLIETTLGIDAYNSLMVTGKIKGSRETMVVGGLRYQEFLRRINLNERRKTFSVTIEDPFGKLVEPGTTYHGKDNVFLDFSTTDPFQSLEAYGMAMRKANDARPNLYDFPTLCGWMVSTGSYGEGRLINNSPELVGQMELAKKSGILKYTPVGIRLEPDYYCTANAGDTQQGWWNDEYWAKYGALLKPYETFGKFCGRIQELGGVPFTYIQTNMPSNDFAKAHPQWMLRGDITRLHAEHRHHMPFVKFDFTDKGFQAHTLATWKRLGRQGLQGIKFDYPESGWIPQGGFDDPNHTTTTAYRKIFELCREGLGPKSYLHERNLGEYGTPCLDVTAGIVDLQRVWGDASHFEPEMASRIGLRWYKNRSVFGYYPDGKSFKKLDTDARRTMLTLVGLLSGRIELGTSFGRMTADEQRDLTRFYPMFPGTRSFRPVDMLLEGRKHPSVYTYRVNDDWTQLIVCNNSRDSEKSTLMKIPLSGDQADTGSLGLDPDGDYYFYDFWNDRLFGESAGTRMLPQTLKPLQALSYSVHRKKDHPQFLSTNRHIMQGLVDLSEVTWSASDKTYSGLAEVVAGEPFVITLANNGFVGGEVEVNAGKASLALVPGGLSRLTIDHDETASVRWSVKWEKSD